MRLTTVILIACLMQVSAAGLAQKVTLNERNAPLHNVLRVIGKQSGFAVFFDGKSLPKSHKVTVVVNNASVEQALDLAFKDLAYTYKIEGKTIAIKPKEAPSFFERTIDGFQEITVTGKIVDENGLPIAGATVKVKGTSMTTVSDGTGIFLLKNISEDAILEISYLGYQVKEVKASKDLGTLKMDVAIGKLNEVTVNAGYYTVKDSERTGSIARITSKDIENQPVTNVLATMQGRMAGVSITQTTGTPGGGFDIKIRGQNSIRPEGNSPLYVIDGVPYASDPIGYNQTNGLFPSTTSPLNSIIPDNIESIEVLKDADATAIYGSKGANGVVLISTKQGKGGKTRFTANASTGVGKVTRFIDLMNTQQYLAMRKQAFINDDLPTYGATDYDINGTWDQNRNTDWQKELLGGSAEFKALQATVSGGSGKTQFLISGNFNSESTVLPGEFIYQKGGSHVSLNHQSLDDKFKIAFTGMVNLQDNDQPAFDLASQARALPPNAPALYTAEGKLNWENGTWDNPLRNLAQKFGSKTKDLVANVLASYEIFPGLNLKSSFGFTDLSTVETRIMPSTISNPGNNVTSATSSIFVNNTNRSSWIIEPQISFDRMLGGGKLGFLIGSTFQSQLTERLYQSGTGFSSDNLIYNLAAARTKNILADDELNYRYQAVFSRINYNFKQRYIVNLTARRDGSSRFGPGKQFANYGAIGAAWLFSNERFLAESRLLSFGKLRASYGVTGNDQIGDYQFWDSYTTNSLSYSGNVGLQPTRLFNPNFAWETNRKLEVALELGFAKDRLFLTGAWFMNRSSNQLVGVPLPGTTGFTVLQSNLDATVQNTGLEWTLRSDNFKGRNFNWTTSVNLSFSKNKLVRFPGLEGSSYSQQYRLGQPLSIELTYKYKGINQQTGLYDFVDLNGDNKITFPEDQQLAVDMAPRYFGGIQNQISFKKWRLDFLFQFVKQKKITYPMGFAGGMSNQLSRLANSWRQSGDMEPFQLYTTGNNSNAISADYLYYSSNAFLVDASYIRLKNLALSYDFPPILKKAQFKLSLQAQNLLTFTKYQDGDPEFTFEGYLPPLKVVTVGIQLTF